MPSAALLLVFLLTLSFTLATQLSLWREQSTRTSSSRGSILEILMGDSRRLFANHFVTKADVYLHSGVYPSIFDQAQKERKSHLAKAADDLAEPENHIASSESHAEHEHEDAASGFLGQPRDCLEAFGRNFYPTRHLHLDDIGQQKEVLPWLRLAVELNPNQPEIYTLSSYWLRQHMGKIKEAEDFLRDGWRTNPDSYEIVFELGRLQEENHHDLARAHNLYELALRKWQQFEAPKKERDELSFLQITGRLARLEQNAGHLDKAIEYLRLLRPLSPLPEKIDQQIADLQAPAK